MIKEVEDPRTVVLDHFGHFLYRLKTRPDNPKVPALEIFLGLGLGLVGPKVPKHFFNHPGSCSLVDEASG